MSNTVNAQGEMPINVANPSMEEIARYFRENNILHSYEVSYKDEPSAYVPYSLGEVSEQTLNDALRLLNAIRYVAGIEADVILDDGYNLAAQGAVLVNAANKGGLSHYPKKPSDMPDKLYKLGKFGASECNLAEGYYNLGDIDAWMNDDDTSNIDRVGHRRWVLNPPMCKVGFGMVHNSESLYGCYTAMYVFNNWYEDTDYRMVVWPARNMPTEFLIAVILGV